MKLVLRACHGGSAADENKAQQGWGLWLRNSLSFLLHWGSVVLIQISGHCQGSDPLTSWRTEFPLWGVAPGLSSLSRAVLSALQWGHPAAPGQVRQHKDGAA